MSLLRSIRPRPAQAHGGDLADEREPNLAALLRLKHVSAFRPPSSLPCSCYSIALFAVLRKGERRGRGQGQGGHSAGGNAWDAGRKEGGGRSCKMRSGRARLTFWFFTSPRSSTRHSSLTILVTEAPFLLNVFLRYMQAFLST